MKSSPMTAMFGGNNCSFDEMDVSVESIRMKLCFPLIWHRFLNALQYEKSNALENVKIKWRENNRKKNYTHCCNCLLMSSLIGAMYSLATMLPLIKMFGIEMDFSISVDVVCVTIELAPFSRL